jgi:hypothetical protein
LLRAALPDLKDKHDLSWGEIERQANVASRRIERFVKYGRKPKDNSDLAKMAGWVASMLRDRSTPLTRALKAHVTVTYAEAKRVWSAYSGVWLCISQSAREDHLYCMVMTIKSEPSTHDKDDFPLPAFSLELGDDEAVAEGIEPMLHTISGYIQLRDDDMYFIGQSTWEPKGRFGFAVFADRPDRERRELMSGWSLLPTLDRTTPTPRLLAATRMTPEPGSPLPLGLINEAQCAAGIPNFPGLVKRLRPG